MKKIENANQRCRKTEGGRVAHKQKTNEEVMEDQRWSRKSSSVSDGRQEAKDEVFHPASQNNHTASTSIHPSDLKTTEREEEEERGMERRSKHVGLKIKCHP